MNIDIEATTGQHIAAAGIAFGVLLLIDTEFKLTTPLAVSLFIGLLLSIEDFFSRITGVYGALFKIEYSIHSQKMNFKNYSQDLAKIFIISVISYIIIAIVKASGRKPYI